MTRNIKIALAVMTGLSAAGASTIAIGADANSQALEEIVVTAQRKSESLQNVPITVTALTGENLAELGVTNFADYAKFVPNLTASSQAPGIGQIYIRGLASTQDGSQSSGATGPFPNVAVYLDDQSAQLPGRNLDVYAADLERIEVLEGPQGTLFGAGAEAGVVRYITNKPKLDREEGEAKASFGTTAGGGDNSSAEVMLNLPIIADKLAIRAVIYNENRGGYINNILGTFTRHANDGYNNALGGAALTGSGVYNNSQQVENNFNPVTYKGMRLSELYKVNDDWSVLLTQSTQSIEADGLFTQEPFAPDSTSSNVITNPNYSVVSFTPNYNRDKFTNLAWTVEGKIADLKAVYSGGYLDRNINQQADYTNYSRSLYGPFYTCPYSPDKHGHYYTQPCSSPATSFSVVEQNTHLSHELRLSTPDDLRIRGSFGAYTEQYRIADYSAWDYITLPNPVQLITPSGLGAAFVGESAPGVGFIDNIVRGYNQQALFGSVDFDIVPKKLILTAGTRYYDETAYQTGVYGHENGGTGAQFGYLCPTSAPCTYTFGANPSYAAQVQNEHTGFKGFRNRFNLTYHVTDDLMTYATVSQGFRPGGFNRGTGLAPSSAVAAGYQIPLTFAPDTLTNVEAGWKSQWLDRRVQFNGAIYQENWNNVQEDFFNPQIFGNLTFTTNGPNYIVKGVEMSLAAKATESLTLEMSGSYNNGYESQTKQLVDSNNNPINWAKYGLSNPFGAVGDSLANSPKEAFAARARYDFTIGDYNSYLQVAGNYRSSSYASTDHLTTDQSGNSIAYLDPGYGLMDISAGMDKNNWHAELYVSNLTNKDAVTYQQATQRILQQSVTAPRIITLRIGYKFKNLVQ